MLSLKNHPFAIQAHFDYSMVFSFAVPKKILEPCIPASLSLDLFNDEFAFFTVALVKVRDLRPKGFPQFVGNHFYLIGHRIFVKYQSQNGKRLRGLFILKSQTDKQKMVMLGNAMTHYNYEKVIIKESRANGQLEVDVSSALSVKARVGIEGTKLPADSPFKNWKEARRFAGPLPFTFSEIAPNKMLIVEGVRSNWKPAPLEALLIEISLDYPFMQHAKLANAFIVENIPYHWKKGRVEVW